MALTPEQLAKAGTEHAEQAALFCWAHSAPDNYNLRWMFAIPNGGHRNAAAAGRLKAEGVKAGAPDIMLPVAVGPYSGLFIELKKRDRKGHKAGGMSAEQIAFGEFLVTQGFRYRLCHGWESARDAILQYLGVDDPTASGALPPRFT